MKQQKVIFLLLVITTILTVFLTTGIGYAAVTDNQLKIYDDVMVSPEQANFKVRFIGRPKSSGDGKVDVRLTGNTSAVMNITGFKSVGDSVTVSFNIKNESSDITAILSQTVTNSNMEYFNVKASLSKNKIGPKKVESTLSITVKLIKAPIEKDEKTNISVKVTATPERYH